MPIVSTRYSGPVSASSGDPGPRPRRNREDLRRKYLSLGVGELFAAAMFGFLASAVVPALVTPGTVQALWSALLPLLVILVQAGIYWLMARTWVGRGSMPLGVARIYRAFRMLDPVLLAAGLVGALVWLPLDAGAVLVLGVWLFGVVEYVNYYLVRLSYPILHWPTRITQWRTPRLSQDIAASR